jgi:hypothetical protein
VADYRLVKPELLDLKALSPLKNFASKTQKDRWFLDFF